MGGLCCNSRWVDFECHSDLVYPKFFCMCSSNYWRKIIQIWTTVSFAYSPLSISVHVFEVLLLNLYFSLISYVEMISFIFNICLHWNLLTTFHQYSFEHPCGSLNILCHYLCLGLIWKLIFSSPVTSAEFSKYAGILSAGIYLFIINKKGNSSYLFLKYYNSSNTLWNWTHSKAINAITKAEKISVTEFQNYYNNKMHLYIYFFSNTLILNIIK